MSDAKMTTFGAIEVWHRFSNGHNQKSKFGGQVHPAQPKKRLFCTLSGIITKLEKCSSARQSGGALKFEPSNNRHSLPMHVVPCASSSHKNQITECGLQVNLSYVE
jgi:hypothetical protein